MRKYTAIFLITIGLLVLGSNLHSYLIGVEAVKSQKVFLNEFKDHSILHKRDFRLDQASPKKGESMGTLSIPKLGVSLPIFHGTNPDQLKRGVGHFAKSALPGEKNNMVLSGHRDTVFRQLGKLVERDELIVSNDIGDFLYKIRKVRIVDEDDLTVIVPKPRATLTVTTCYPFYYIGNAPQRYVVIAELISSNLKKSKKQEDTS
ncbi:class D sortase [Aquibacillus halophilus]|uniref:Class D sortase n=1 Tax=Aquibacillus halophilus TaxID=930132 RepID=A0A6A8DTC3_9BACI|nr:class D sortase [Aquibacillus halophilus]MRH44472.1 class D sortase [Aquibacillus halophilus]